MIKFNKNPISTESGIYIYSTDDFYWFTDISRDKIRLLYERLGSQDLFSACQNVGIKTGYLADYYRSDFIYFLPYKNNEDFSVLDLGSGFGNITIPLSKKMPKASIFAVDGSLDILKILSRRIEKEARNNVSLVKVGAFENMDLPFVQKSFDLIIMNGVLEWIGSGKDKGIPKSIQIEFLKYIKTLLKDNGNLYIGIEGRFFPGYFFNVKDPHSGIMFTSILPRSLSDFVCKLKGKKEGYRTYTYSSKGYLSLFKKAGFKSENIEMIYPVASYKDPYNLFSVKDKKSYSYAFKRLYKKIFPTIKSILLNKILYFLNLEKFFAASYLFNIGNSNQTDNRLLDFYLKDFVNPDEFEPIKIQSNLSNNGFVNFILLSKKDGCPKYFFKIKRYSDISKEKLDNIGGLKDCKENVLLPIKHNSVSMMYEYIDGTEMKKNVDSIKKAINLIRSIHLLHRTDEEKKFGVIMHKGFMHGDYTLENIIKKDDILKVIDIDDFSNCDYQIFDILSLLLHYFSITKKEKSIDLVNDLLSKDTYSLIKLYDDNIPYKILKELWILFLQKEIEKTQNYRESKSFFYNEILLLLSK